MGVPGKYSKKCVEALCENIRSGLPLEYAAALAGVAYRSVRTWMDDETVKGADSKYAGTTEMIAEAKAKSIEVHVQNITKAGCRGDWRASAWMLERRHPDHFGFVQRVTGGDGGPVQVEVSAEAEAAERVLARLKSAESG